MEKYLLSILYLQNTFDWIWVKKLKKERHKLGLSCAKLSLASAKLHTSLSSDKLKLPTN